MLAALTPTIGSRIASRIAALRASGALTEEAEAARRGALLLYSDPERSIAITPLGELLEYRAAPTLGRVIELPERCALWRYQALASGARTYPELSALLPARTLDDSTCPSCLFRQAHRFYETVGVICRCAGTGWLPREAAAVLRLRTRAATPADLHAVRTLDRDVFPGCAYGATVLRQMYDTAPSLLLVAEEDEGVIGYALGALAAGSPRAWIHALAVRFASRRRGVGRLLVADLLDRLTALGARSVRLTLEPARDGARSLYESFGFEPVEHDPAYYGPGEEALVLERPLPVPFLRTPLPHTRA